MSDKIKKYLFNTLFKKLYYFLLDDNTGEQVYGQYAFQIKLEGIRGKLRHG